MFPIKKVFIILYSFPIKNFLSNSAVYDPKICKIMQFVLKILAKQCSLWYKFLSNAVSTMTLFNKIKDNQYDRFYHTAKSCKLQSKETFC